MERDGNVVSVISQYIVSIIYHTFNLVIITTTLLLLTRNEQTMLHIFMGIFFRCFLILLHIDCNTDYIAQLLCLCDTQAHKQKVATVKGNRSKV